MHALHAFAISSALLGACNATEPVLESFMTRSMTVTYNKLDETAQAYLNVVNRRGRTKVRFVAFVALIVSFEEKFCWFLTL